MSRRRSILKIVFWKKNRKCTEWPKMTLYAAYKAKGTPYMLKYCPRVLPGLRSVSKRLQTFCKFPISGTRLLRKVCKLFPYWTQPQFSLCFAPRSLVFQMIDTLVFWATTWHWMLSGQTYPIIFPPSPKFNSLLLYDQPFPS